MQKFCFLHLRSQKVLHIGMDVVVMPFVMSKMYELSLLETSCHEAFPFIADDAETQNNFCLFWIFNSFCSAF